MEIRKELKGNSTHFLCLTAHGCSYGTVTKLISRTNPPCLVRGQTRSKNIPILIIDSAENHPVTNTLYHEVPFSNYFRTLLSRAQNALGTALCRISAINAKGSREPWRTGCWWIVYRQEPINNWIALLKKLSPDGLRAAPG